MFSDWSSSDVETLSGRPGVLAPQLLPVGQARLRSAPRRKAMYTIAVILVVLWLLGLVTSYTMGGLIHILLVLAIISVLVRLIQGRNPVA